MNQQSSAMRVMGFKYDVSRPVSSSAGTWKFVEEDGYREKGNELIDRVDSFRMLLFYMDINFW